MRSVAIYALFLLSMLAAYLIGPHDVVNAVVGLFLSGLGTVLMMPTICRTMRRGLPRRDKK